MTSHQAEVVIQRSKLLQASLAEAIRKELNVRLRVACEEFRQEWKSLGNTTAFLVDGLCDKLDAASVYLNLQIMIEKELNELVENVIEGIRSTFLNFLCNRIQQHIQSCQIQGAKQGEYKKHLDDSLQGLSEFMEVKTWGAIVPKEMNSLSLPQDLRSSSLANIMSLISELVNKSKVFLPKKLNPPSGHWPASIPQKLQQLLNTNNLEYVEVPKDGNCQFHAASQMMHYLLGKNHQFSKFKKTCS